MLSVEELIKRVNEFFVNPLIVLLTAVAAVVFLWGMFEFVSNLDNEDERAVGKRHIIWGIIGLVIMFGALGIIEIIKNTFGIPLD